MIYHDYISLYLFFIFIFYLFLEIEPFIPARRLGHSTVLVDNKLYFFGGEKDTSSLLSDAFYLDVSRQFKIASPPFYELTEMPIRSSWGAFSLSVTNNEQNVYLLGGRTQNITTNVLSLTPIVYKFNLKLEKWETPTIKGMTPINRLDIRATSDNSGKIYIFGGFNENNVLNDMIIFNVIESSWSTIQPLNAPKMAGHSATLLPNGVIVYIGGYNELLNVDISQINLYNTNSLKWSVQKTNLPNQIDNRDGHTAVLTPDGRIIIYGGSKVVTGNNDTTNFQANPNLAVLNTITNPFEWSTPLVSSNIGVPSLTAHTADLVGDYMIVAFGNITQPNAYPASTNANIYIMNIRNYTWVDRFEPPIPSSANPSPTIPSAPPTFTVTATPTNVDSQLSTMKVVIGTIGGILGIVILIITGFFGYKWYQRNRYQRNQRRDEIIRIHGEI